MPLSTLLTPQTIAALFGMDFNPISALSGTTAGHHPTPPVSSGMDMGVWPQVIYVPAAYQYGQPLTPVTWSPAHVQYPAAQRGPAVAQISNIGDIRGKSVP
jgi:hypothetical protein